jgi:hypothetical protein
LRRSIAALFPAKPGTACAVPVLRGGGTTYTDFRDGLRRPGNRDGGGPRFRSVGLRNLCELQGLVARLLGPETDLIFHGKPGRGRAHEL